MDEYDWELFGRLMERYDSIETVIAMMSQIKPNNRRLAGISEQLKAGGQFAETLNNSPLEKQLRFFLQFLSLAKALRVTLSYRRQGHHISKLLVSSLSYPLAVLMAGLAVLAVFEKVVLPSFGSTLELSITDSAGAVTVFRLIGIMRNGLIILILIAVILIFYVLISRRANYVWVFLHRLRHRLRRDPHVGLPVFHADSKAFINSVREFVIFHVSSNVYISSPILRSPPELRPGSSAQCNT